jgi:hypothetical protein
MLEQVSQYRHYRNIKTGNIYYVWAIAKHSENPSELLVIYSDGSKDVFWARPLGLFKEKFEETGSSENWV